MYVYYVQLSNMLVYFVCIHPQTNPKKKKMKKKEMSNGIVSAFFYITGGNKNTFRSSCKPNSKKQLSNPTACKSY